MLYNILKSLKPTRNSNSLKCLLRSYSTSIYSKDFDVTQFCTIEVKCPYDISIKPIDVFQSQEKVLVKLQSDGDTSPSIQCKQTGDTVVIEGETCSNSNDVKLNVEASVKANVRVIGHEGRIRVGSFFGKYIDVKSTTGDVSLSKSQCDRIHVTTEGGSISCEGILQAADVKLETKKTGSVTTDRVQGINMRISTTSGDITTGSTYCDSSLFKTDFGKLHLQNAHKNVTVNIDHEGMLNLSGFDGTLTAKINKGLVDVQLSRVAENSLIYLEESGTLILRVSDECQETTNFKVAAENCVVAPAVRMESAKSDELLLLFPKSKNKSEAVTVVVDCKNSHVLIDASSWSDMFQVNLNNKM